MFGDYFGDWKASLMRFAEILKNPEKHCKVLQKSRSGGSQNLWKIISKGKLGQKLRLSWLVRVQVGAKRGNLTLLGALRGTKMEFKGALQAPREANSGPEIRLRCESNEQSEPGSQGGVGEG